MAGGGVLVLKNQFIERLEELLSERVNGLTNKEIFQLVQQISEKMLYDAVDQEIICPKCKVKTNIKLPCNQAFTHIEHPPKNAKRCRNASLVVYQGTVRSFRKGRSSAYHRSSEPAVARFYDPDGQERQVDYCGGYALGVDLKSKDKVMIILGVNKKDSRDGEFLYGRGVTRNLTIKSEFAETLFAEGHFTKEIKKTVGIGS